MKKLAILFFFGLHSVVFAQNYSVQLQSGSFLPAENTQTSEPSRSEIVNNHYYRVIQFYKIPTSQQKSVIESKGVKLYNYLPNNCFMASIPVGLSINTINRDNNIRSIFPLEKKHKLSAELGKKQYPSYALKGGGKIELFVLHHPDISTFDASTELRSQGIEIEFELPDQNALRVLENVADIDKLSAMPQFYFIEPADSKPQPENLLGRTSHRSNVIATDYSGGLKFDGTGVNVALNDDGVIGPHIDYTGRTVQYITFNNGDHGDHCAGIIFGSGNIDPTTKGMAFGADLGVYGVSNSFPNVYQAFDSISNHYNSKGTRIISTSYGDGNNTGYTSRARLMDLQINTMPEMIHVFSAGNSGTSDYGYGAGAGWGNITGGHKQAKNVITVGNLNATDGLSSSSSRGPARDGRIKPDICAVGSSVYSTVDANSYDTKSGTSMACPGVAGSVAQLYHAYKSIHSSNPPSALIKAVVLNTGEDLGNPGPDYRFGYGRINARRALNVIQNNQHVSNSVSQGTSNTHTITVPANTAELRVMVYWHDAEATAGVAKALVNNLDMTVTTPSAQTVLPWVLNRTPTVASLNANAVQSVDTLNNMEQVTIATPTAGSYVVTVNGFSVPGGTQAYFVVYEFIPQDEIKVTYPIGGESLVPGVQETIRWDALGNTGTFSARYSTDSGITWNTIFAFIPATSRHITWTPPATVTGKAMVQISRGTFSDQSDETFSIIGVPSNLTVDWVCMDSFKVSYNAVTGATGYIVTVLGNKYMDSAAFSTTTSCVVKGVNTTQAGWYSVQAIGPNGCIGRRALAKQRPVLPLNCNVTNDLGISNYAMLSDSSVISCQFSPISEPVSIDIVNYGSNVMTGTTAKYSVNGGTPVAESIPTIAAFTTITHTFTQPISFSTPGIYNIKLWIENAADGTSANDTIEIVKHFIQPSLQVLPFNEDFEAFSLCDTTANCAVTQCLLSSGWTNERNDIDDDIDWRIYSGSTPTGIASGTTGPSMDKNPGTATGKYAYLEATNCVSKTASLVSPCFDLSTVSNPTLMFGYHMFGNGMGSLHVDALTNGQWMNDIATPIVGDQGNSWHTASVSLNSFAGQTISIRLRGITGMDEESDMAIDDILVSSAQTSVIDNNLSGLQLFPNPSKGLFYIQLPSNTNAHIQVTDINGRIIKSETMDGHNASIDLQQQPTGVYILTIKNDKAVVVKKIVKQ